MKTLIVFLLAAAVQLVGQDMESCPMHKEHMKADSQHPSEAQRPEAQKEVEKHGDEAMGFPHDKTTHHFRFYGDGGAIEVTVNDGKDSQNIQAIRSHLTHIAKMFSAGDFSVPMFVHDQVPPGSLVMKERRGEISYTYEELPLGARVRIKTTNSGALKAVHDFLLFQIGDHHTGDTDQITTASGPPVLPRE